MYVPLAAAETASEAAGWAVLVLPVRRRGGEAPDRVDRGPLVPGAAQGNSILYIELNI